MENKNRPAAMIFALLPLLLMVAASELFGEREIIFPEITALAVGALFAPRQPWRTSKFRLVLLVAVYAVLGVLAGRYLPVPTAARVILLFPIAGLGLCLSRTTFMPLISACILPVLLGSTSWIYPISATVMAIIVVLLQALQERLGLRPPLEYTPAAPDWKREARLWGKRWILMAVVCLLALAIDKRFLLAPPLLVAFTELSTPGSPARKRPLGAIGLIAFCAFVGTAWRVLLCGMAGLPLTLAAVLSGLCIYLFMEKIRFYMPPAAALGTLPYLILPEQLLLYPFQVSGGAVILVTAAIFFFLDDK